MKRALIIRFVSAVTASVYSFSAFAIDPKGDIDNIVSSSLEDFKNTFYDLKIENENALVSVNNYNLFLDKIVSITHVEAETSCDNEDYTDDEREAIDNSEYLVNKYSNVMNLEEQRLTQIQEDQKEYSSESASPSRWISIYRESKFWELRAEMLRYADDIVRTVNRLIISTSNDECRIRKIRTNKTFLKYDSMRTDGLHFSHYSKKMADNDINLIRIFNKKNFDSWKKTLDGIIKYYN